MAAYAVFIRNSTASQAGLDEYAVKARAARGEHKFEPLVFYNPCETKEGDAAEGVVILKFADMAAAKAWYESDAYQEAAKVRQAASDYRVILTEGL